MADNNEFDMTHGGGDDGADSPQRRRIMKAVAAGALTTLASGVHAVAAGAEQTGERRHDHHAMHGKPLQVAMLVHPDMFLLDLVGPQTFFSMMKANVHLVWKDRTPVMPDVGLPVPPTTTFAQCPKDLDILFVPGGLIGTVKLMDDAEVLEFLADRGSRARYVTSVCTGALLLGAAGLLRGYRATAHWEVRELLPLMGATLEVKRVVQDRNRLTGGGVTAGIDFGLMITALLQGEEHAKHYQLAIEYDPDPPFDAGNPQSAGPATTAFLTNGRKPLVAAARAAAVRSGQRLGVEAG